MHVFVLTRRGGCQHGTHANRTAYSLGTYASVHGTNTQRSPCTTVLYR